jgi:hypothetical protein
MRWVSTMFTLVCAAILGAASDALADHVALKNGDSLTGRITNTTPTELTIATDLAGRVTIKRSDVSQITTTAPGTQPADGSGWNGTLAAGVDISRGNSETRTISTSGNVTRIGSRDRLGFFGTSLYSAIGTGAEAVTTVRATRGGLRYDHDLLDRLYGFEFGDAENDPLQLLNLRTVVGGGAGVHLLKTGATQFNAFGGVSYARDSYTEVTTTTTTTTTSGTPVTTPGQGGTPPGKGGTPPGQARIQNTRRGSPPSIVRTALSRNVGEWLIGHDLTHQLSDSIGLNESLTVFPAVGDLHDYRVSFDFSVWAQLNGWLQWNANVADRYLNIPPSGGAVQNDTYISTGLGITFGHGGGGYGGADGRRPRR